MINIHQSSLRLKVSSERLKNTGFFRIIFQRLILLFHHLLCCFSGTKSDTESEYIILEHKQQLTTNMLSIFNNVSITKKIEEENKFEIESGAPFDLPEISEDAEVTDEEFKSICEESAYICSWYVKIFLIFEVISKAADLGSVAILPLYAELGINHIIIIVSLCIFIPIILFQVFCDWGKLIEKYSSLVYNFIQLKKCKDHDRVEKYERLVSNFKSYWLYSDNITIITHLN